MSPHYAPFRALALIIGSADNFVPPKIPYSFDAMLSDILSFAAATLVDDGRLCIWIPAENELEEAAALENGAAAGDAKVAISETTLPVKREVGIPKHPALALVSVSTQAFSRCKLDHTGPSIIG